MKGRANVGLRCEEQVAAVFFDNDVMRQTEPLAGALADFLGREKQIEYFVLNVWRYACAIVADQYFNRLGRGFARLDSDQSFSCVFLLDGMRGVDDQIQKYLIQLAGVAFNQADVGRKIGFDFGNVFVSVSADGQRAVDSIVQIDGLFALRWRHVREGLHGFDDFADALDAFKCILNRLGAVIQDEVEVVLIGEFSNGVLCRIVIAFQQVCVKRLDVIQVFTQ